jgi:murein DD-endopeptidase MepM/ murein hydrolase activator NlpD
MLLKNYKSIKNLFRQIIFEVLGSPRLRSARPSKSNFAQRFFYYTIIILSLSFSIAHADTASDLKSKIDDRTAQIQKLEEQLKQYNTQVDLVNKEAKTLQSNIKSLDLTKKKITTDITLTEKKIDKTNLTITEIGNEVDNTKEKISSNKDSIAQMIRNSQREEDLSVFEMVLGGKNIADAWNDLDNIQKVRDSIREKTDELHILQSDLELKQENLLGQKKQLTSLKKDLDGKKQAVQATVQEKSAILAQTKNKEQTYKQLIAATEAQKAAFEKEIFEFESQLKLTIDKSGYPAPYQGILAWPLDDVYITQLFGKTVGAEKLYTSGSHNGVDFRASTGTKVKNVLDGVVVGTGNTDQYPGCYSFGKWVMVKHTNGLSTIYGHLSVISVSTGQNLATGDTIGFSGNTGYSTGPHLHISVYATQGVRIEKFTNSKGCKQATIPLADIKAYLDPMAYFPKI